MSIELNKIIYNLSALADLGHEVTSATQFNTKIRSMLYVIMGTFVSVRGAVLFYRKDHRRLVTLTRKGFDGSWAPEKPVSAEQIRNLGKNEAYTLGNGDAPQLMKQWFDQLRSMGAEILVPLWTKDRFVGALVLSAKLGAEKYGPDDFELLKVIAHQMAITLNNHELFLDLAAQVEKNRRLYDEMRRIYHDTIQAFAAAIDAKDEYTKNHSYRVAKYVVAIGRELQWDEQEIEGLYIAGLLHDVGKIILSDEVLKKKRSLSDVEAEEVRLHSKLSFDIISKINFPWKNIVNTVRHHHERLDGNGYPDALSDDELTDAEKALILADSFDAMTTDRPYRKRLSLKQALDELTRHRGTQFDGKILAAFCRVLEKEINGELPQPDILPHLDETFDASIITALLEAIRVDLL